MIVSFCYIIDPNIATKVLVIPIDLCVFFSRRRL